MVRAQPLIALADVEAGSKWFQAVLGLRSGHGGADYEMLMDGDELVAQLHHWDADDHPHLGDQANPSRGNGVLLWFSTDDFDRALERVGGAEATVLDGPLFNANAGQREIWLSGPEGYRVVVAGPREQAH
jgi:catechol 2,3-dioxygenase-like lactoylglutathione lyase family enzyme